MKNIIRIEKIRVHFRRTLCFLMLMIGINILGLIMQNIANKDELLDQLQFNYGQLFDANQLRWVIIPVFLIQLYLLRVYLTRFESVRYSVEYRCIYKWKAFLMVLGLMLIFNFSNLLFCLFRFGQLQEIELFIFSLMQQLVLLVILGSLDYLLETFLNKRLIALLIVLSLGMFLPHLILNKFFVAFFYSEGPFNWFSVCLLLMKAIFIMYIFYRFDEWLMYRREVII